MTLFRHYRLPRDLGGQAEPTSAFRPALDEKGFIRTGADVGSTERVPLPLETGVEGIFAVGDVRCGSVKRVGAAIGEGAAVVAQLHTFMDRRASTSDGATFAQSPPSAAPLS